MIRVLIKRTLLKGKETDYHRTVRQLKQKASHQQGYISGEVLVDPKNSCSWLILSTWEDLISWNHWAESEERNVAKAKIRKMLTADEAVSIYESATFA